MNTLEELVAFSSVWLSDPLVASVFGIVLATAFLSYASRRTLLVLMARVTQTQNPWDDALLRTIRTPLNVLIWIVGLSLAAELVAEARSQSQIEIIGIVRYLAFIGLVTLFLARLIRELEAAYRQN